MILALVDVYAPRERIQGVMSALRGSSNSGDCHARPRCGVSKIAITIARASRCDCEALLHEGQWCPEIMQRQSTREEISQDSGTDVDPFARSGRAKK